MVASMPCYSEGNVDEQRGRGVFERSIAGLRALNAAGYGIPGSGLTLDLVYNPNGAFLAPPQQQLQVRSPYSLAGLFGSGLHQYLIFQEFRTQSLYWEDVLAYWR